MTTVKFITAVQATLRCFKRCAPSAPSSIEWFSHFHFALLLCLLTSHIGSSSFIVAPSNYSTCLGSNATFSCVVNVTGTLEWTINGQHTSVYNISNPAVYPLTPAGAQTTLIVPGDYELDGIAIVCSYSVLQGAPVYSMSAFLTAQAPSVLAANTCKVAAVGSSISTAVGVSVSVTFVVSFSMGVLVASVLCYISRKSIMSADKRRPHAGHVTVYDEVGTNKKMKCDVMEMNENTAYGYHVTQNH
ncbi:hypothetical protein EMCRGX_G001146 [Ephydatia muelleri]